MRLHMPSIGFGTSGPYANSGHTHAPTPTGDYAPSLRSPWRAAPEVPDWLPTQLAERSTDRRAGDSPYHSFVELRLDLLLPQPFLINDPQQAAMSGFDHAPLIHIDARGARLVLPGASLRGVLRSQCERIARTLATLQAKDLDDFGRCCPACDPNQRPTRTKDKDKDRKETAPADHPLVSCASIAEDWLKRQRDPAEGESELVPGKLCPACQLFGSTLFGSRLRVEGGSCPMPDRDAARARDFLAIDRFTGGVKGSAKFDAQVPAFDAEIPVRLFLENPSPAELGWLYLGLRDLAEGLVNIGFGAAKGFGRIELRGGELGVGRLPGALPDLGLADKPDAEASAASLFEISRYDWSDPGQRSAVEQAAAGWVAAFNRDTIGAGGFRRDDNFRLHADSWFGAGANPGMETLFPKEIGE